MTVEQEAKLDLVLAKLDLVYNFMTGQLKDNVSMEVWSQVLPLPEVWNLITENGSQFITEDGLYITGE